MMPMPPPLPPSRAPGVEITARIVCRGYSKPHETVPTCPSCAGVFCSRECVDAGCDTHKAHCPAKELGSRPCATCGEGVPDGQGYICRTCGTVFCTEACFKQSPCGLRNDELRRAIEAAVAKLIVETPMEKRRGVQTVVCQAVELVHDKYTAGPANQTCSAWFHGEPGMGPSDPFTATLTNAPPSGAAAAAATQLHLNHTTQPAAANASPATGSVAVAPARRKRKRKTTVHLLYRKPALPATPAEQAAAAAALHAAMNGLRAQFVVERQ